MGLGEDKSCGPGLQRQKRTCVDGSLDKCAISEKERILECSLSDCIKKFGNWTDDGFCEAIAVNKSCGPGTLKQSRICIDGTKDKCEKPYVEQIISCDLPDCPKHLGSWRDQGALSCVTDGVLKNCGPGKKSLIRHCIDGTKDKCTKHDRGQIVRCNLPDCPKRLSYWTDTGGCQPLIEGQLCGNGELHQTRGCIDGTSEKCNKNDTNRNIRCKLPDCYKKVGNWSDVGECKAMEKERACGPGIQKQTRECIDGVNFKCSETDKEHFISCTLDDCPKVLGIWVNDGFCKALGPDTSCGPGDQVQRRNCIDGTIDKCMDTDSIRNTSCDLPDCVKRFGNWVNVGRCKANQVNKQCGPGTQKQNRTCIDGTVDKCISIDREHIIPCSLPDCPKVFGNWSDVGSCEAAIKGKGCGSGNQRQIRSCIDGTVDKCSPYDRERNISCSLMDCPKVFGSWANNGTCHATGKVKSCGPGFQQQTRTCNDGTNDKCNEHETIQNITCMLRDCTGDHTSIFFI